jgi:lysine biosynthesis protein LysW
LQEPSKNKEEVKMDRTHCPSCDAVILRDEDSRMGAMITCHECGTELEIIGTYPFEVDFPIDYSRDWEEEEYE